MTLSGLFIELNARARARSLMDSGSWRELVGPFERIESPWLLPEQGIVPQSDDGCVVHKGKIAAKPAVVVALEGGFQAGSTGEVSGAKITARSISRPGIRKMVRTPPRFCCWKRAACARCAATGGCGFRVEILAQWAIFYT
jgi:acetyl-CoA carboxylase beta subunit